MATKDDFLTFYPQFVQQHGIIFEKTEIPMDETDRKKTKQFYWVILFLFLLFSGIGGAAYYFNDSKGLTVGWVFFIVIAVSMVGYFYYALNKALARGTKFLIKGIVTAKKKGKSLFVELSAKEHFTVSTRDYEALHHGDIVQIEKVGTSIPFVQKITRVGSIFDVMT